MFEGSCGTQEQAGANNTLKTAFKQAKKQL
jgi:hypothetical protein